MSLKNNLNPEAWHHCRRLCVFSVTIVLYACQPHTQGPFSASKEHKHKTNQTSKTRADLICRSPAQYQGKVVGDGHCVSLIKLCSSAPVTSYWRPGEYVVKSRKLAPGTVIATFENIIYPNHEGHHAAIYISHDENGIWVWDQWQGMPVHRRLIRFRDASIVASNRAQDYQIVVLD